MFKLRILITGCVLALTVGAAHATTVQTVGAGSAVTTVDASASFTNSASLTDNPYIEDGISFSRTNLTFNNNGCGYAGCGGISPDFTGNYMYGAGTGGYFTIATTGGNSFSGLEFVISSGFGISSSAPDEIFWETLLNGNIVGSGSSTFTSVSVIGFSDSAGFDTLIFSSTDPNDFPSCSLFASACEFNPAFDTVNAQYTSVSTTPLPPALQLFASGLGALGLLARRRKRKAAAAIAA